MGADEKVGWLRWTASIVASTALGIGLMSLAGSALHATRAQALIEKPAAQATAGERCLAPALPHAG